MGKKHYSQSIKDEAVLFYELGHSFAETQAKYGMAESTFFTWKQKFDKAHPMHEAITTNRTTCHKSKRHLEKLALELEVLRQCPCGRNASIDEKVAAVNALRGRYSIHVLCNALSLPRGTYYNRKRRAGQRTSYEINDEKLKPLIRQIFHDSKNRFGRKPIHHKLAELGYKVSEKRIVRLMKEMGLSVAKPCYKAEHQKSLPRAYFRNLLARQFDQPQPNLIWVSDITYIKVLDQYYYICVVLDLFSRRILSYSISDSINTALTLAAFDDACNLTTIQGECASHNTDKKLQLEERKLVEQAKHIANPTEGKSQPAEIGLFDEMVLGIQNYYKIATCISLDCRKLHRRVMTVLTNRLNTESGCQLVREGGVMTESEKARFGASAMVRYVSGINRPIYPIAFIKYKMAIGISPAVCCFSTAGRKKIHDMLEVDMTLFSGLREHLPDAHSMEYADCRLSLLAVQKGVCSISGEKFVTATEIACHLKTPKEYGGLERYSNLVLIHKKYVPLLQIGDAKSLRDICRLLKVTKKQLTKINTLRKAAKLAAI